MLRTLRVQNVRHAYSEGIFLVAHEGIAEPSRNGPVLVLDGPLVTTYERPDQRVLIDPLRDANPFFHLLEAFWMLAGRRDLASVMQYNSGMRKYSDDGENFHGAYGHRWRRHWLRFSEDGEHATELDQLATVIGLLRANANDRRVVISMWNPESDLGLEGLDFPCNTQLYLRVRQACTGLASINDDVVQQWEPVLDMTVMCRSNDMLWGGYGANAVQFSVLQEFIASMIGVRVGEMHQLSNNAHLYQETMPDVDAILPYAGYAEATVPLFGDLRDAPVADVLAEIEALWDNDDDAEVDVLPISTLRLVGGMRIAWRGWKNKSWDDAMSGIDVMDVSGHEDWTRACREWLERRRDKFR